PRDPLELLIREARERQRKRRLGVAVAIALLAGAALGIESILSGGNPTTARKGGGPSAALGGRNACGVRGLGIRSLDANGRTVYREPGDWVHPNAGRPEIRCNGANVWAVWDNGAGMSKEAYVGASSGDAGRTWRLVFSEPFFGVKAPHALDAYLGPWTLRGHAAYFTGWCPACGSGTG